jgi:hypothetical protein
VKLGFHLLGSHLLQIEVTHFRVELLDVMLTLLKVEKIEPTNMA